MKPYLPYNILLALTLVVTGAAILYNTVLRESYITTLRYEYPAVVEQMPEQAAAPGPEYFLAGNQMEEESLDEGEQADTAVTSVQFPLELNVATTEQLKFIPQVGEVMSQRIVQYREHLGGYTDLAQLMEIQGVGEKTYEHLYTYLYLSDEMLYQPAQDDNESPENAGDEDENHADSWQSELWLSLDE